jgi:diguanylate cyclase (GGDEF)-like protein
VRRGRDLVRLVAVAVIAPVTSSLAVVIWNASLGLDFLTGQRIWRGWIIGDFLQTLLVVAPLLYFLGQPVRSWIDHQFDSSPRSEVTYTRTALLAFLVFAIMGAVVFVGIGMLERSLDIDPEARTLSGEPLRPRLFEIQFFLGLLVAALILATGVFSTALARMSERQRGLARRESLTGCFNRRAFYELFPRESDRSRRLQQGLAVVFLDVDHFKTINDRLGHEMGDHVLQQLARRVRGVIRETDLLFRWGGEEFVILLPHTTPDDAFSLAERVRAAIADRPFLANEIEPAVTVTASLGTSGTLAYPVAPDELLTRADAACYRAKEQGRNRVVVGEPAPVELPTAAASAG